MKFLSGVTSLPITEEQRRLPIVNQFPKMEIRVGDPIPLTRAYWLGAIDTGAEVAVALSGRLIVMATHKAKP